MFQALQADIARLAEIVPVLTAYIASLQAQITQLQEELAAAQNGLPALETQLKEAVDAISALTPPAA